MLLMTNLIWPKRSWVFFLELPLDILVHVNTIFSKKSGVNPAMQQVISQNNAGICPCFSEDAQDFKREDQLKDLQNRCSLKGQTGTVFVLKWRTPQLNSPFTSALLPSSVEKQSVGSLNPNNKNLGIAGGGGSSLHSAKVCFSKTTGETDLSVICTQQMCRHKLLRVRRT